METGRGWRGSVLAWGAAILGVLLLTDSLLAAAAVLLLWAIWLPWPGMGGVPAISLALSIQWVQICTALLYESIAGVPLPEFREGDAHRMLLLGIPSLAALWAGIRLGWRVGMRGAGGRRPVDRAGWRLDRLLVLYAGAVGLSAVLGGIAWSLSGLTQQVLALGALRFVLLFLVTRELMERPRGLRWVLLILCLEVLFGFGSLFSVWKTPIFVAFLATVAAMHPGNRARLGTFAALLGLSVFALGIVWMGVRGDYRAEARPGESKVTRYERLGNLLEAWFEDFGSRSRETAQLFFVRLTGGPYPAVVLDRVPEVVPHEEGVLIGGAVAHVLQPRILFPEKAAIVSDSEKVRQYTGLWVAGEESGTSVGLSYVAEAYIDFGFGFMLVPILLYGLLTGWCTAFLLSRVRSRPLGIAVVAVLTIMIFEKFEIPWTKILGNALTLLVVIGVLTLLTERWFLRFAGAPLPAGDDGPAAPPPGGRRG